MRYALAIAALLFAPFVLELLPKDVLNALATFTMLGLCAGFTGLFLWIGLKK